MKFTAKQLQNWKAYEIIRVSGRFNMFDVAAMQATGLYQEEYTFVMKNYSELHEAFLIEAENPKPTPDTVAYIQSILQGIAVIQHWSFIDEAECRKILKQVDDILDTLREHLEGK